MNFDNTTNSFLDVLKTLSEEGRETAGKLFSQKHFFVAQTPDFMKEYGLNGDSFTISYGTISRHFGKDIDHNLNLGIWEQLPKAITTPFAITEYYKDTSHEQKRGYRLYTTISIHDGFVVVGIDVKVAGRNLLVNSFSTVFGKRGKVTEREIEIFRSKKTNPQQAALLKRPNSSQYPSIGDSDRKNTTKN